MASTKRASFCSSPMIKLFVLMGEAAKTSAISFTVFTSIGATS
jgi:hypothetical protein